MSESIQYLINQAGERTGVLLDLDEYQRLARQVDDPEQLTGLSQTELEALAESMLAPERQRRLDDLLARNAENALSPGEEAELDRLLTQVDQLTILKTRARYTLTQLAINSSPQ